MVNHQLGGSTCAGSSEAVGYSAFAISIQDDTCLMAAGGYASEAERHQECGGNSLLFKGNFPME
jgi:hypothetical protein